MHVWHLASKSLKFPDIDQSAEWPEEQPAGCLQEAMAGRHQRPFAGTINVSSPEIHIWQ
jgi:hypothetical protein